MLQPLRNTARNTRTPRALLAARATLHHSATRFTTVKPMVVPRDLPDPTKDRRKLYWGFTTFAAIMTVSVAAIFNYEKTQNPIIDNTLYQLRRSEQVRELLGARLELDGLLPWIKGTLNPMAGKVDIRFNIKGDKGKLGLVRLVADRENREQHFFIHQWSVQVGDEIIDLLKEGGQKYID